MGLAGRLLLHNGKSLSQLVNTNYLTDFKVYICSSSTTSPAALQSGGTLEAWGTDLTDSAINRFGQACSTGPDAANVGINFSYTWIAGMNENENPDSGLSFDVGKSNNADKSNHEKYGNILYVDGSARAAVGVDWTGQIKFRGETTKKSGSASTELFTKDNPPSDTDDQLTK